MLSEGFVNHAELDNNRSRNLQVKNVENQLNELSSKVETVMESREDSNILINTALARLDELMNMVRSSQASQTTAS